MTVSARHRPRPPRPEGGTSADGTDSTVIYRGTVASEGAPGRFLALEPPDVLPMTGAVPPVAAPTTAPTVGVVVTAFRRRTFLPRALRSLGKGSNLPDQVVVVEDNPPYDVRADILVEQALPSVPGRCLNGSFPNVGSMLEQGLRQCTTDVVAFLDDDDLFLPDKVAAVRRCFATRPEVGYFHHNMQLVDEDLKPIPMRRRNRRLPRGVIAAEPGAWMRSRVATNASSISVRRGPTLPNAAAIREVEAATDLTLFWLALRSDLVPYNDPTILTLKQCYLASTSRQRGTPRREIESFRLLLARSRPGGPEERLARWLVDATQQLFLRSDRPSRGKDLLFRLLGFIQRTLPRGPASWFRRATLMVLLALNF